MRQLLRHPHLFEAPADVGTDPHAWRRLVNGAHAVLDVPQTIFGGHITAGAALHLVPAETLFPSHHRLLARVLRRLVAGTHRDRHAVAEPSAEQLPHRHAEGLSAQIEHGLLEGLAQSRGPLRQVHAEHVGAQPAAHRLLHDGVCRHPLDLRQTGEAVVGFDFGDEVFVALMAGLAVFIVRPPPVGLGDVDEVQGDLRDLHFACPNVRRLRGKVLEIL